MIPEQGNTAKLDDVLHLAWSRILTMLLGTTGPHDSTFQVDWSMLHTSIREALYSNAYGRYQDWYRLPKRAASEGLEDAACPKRERK